MRHTRYLLLIMIFFIVITVKGHPAEQPLERSITKKGLIRHLQALQRISNESNGNRLTGTKGHQLTMDYILTTLRKAGYQPELQEIKLNRIDTIENTLNVTDANQRRTSFEASLISGAPSTPKTGINGRIVALDDACGLIDDSISGEQQQQQQPWIALVKAGKCSSTEMATMVQRYGAKAMLIYKPKDSKTIRFSQPFQAHIPAGDLSTEAALQILDMMDHDSSILVDIKLTMITNSVPVTSFNIIGETKSGNRSNVVMMGTHSDSVGKGPGINDDGSGLAAALELATHIDQTKLVNSVRFCWWTAEEQGIVGSKAYMDSLSPNQKESIALYLNADMVASMNYVNYVYDGNESQAPADLKPAPRGSMAIQKAFEQYFDENKQAHQLLSLEVVEQRSDATPFYNAMIPAGGVSTGFSYIKTEKEQEAYGGTQGIAHDRCYHQACDTLDNINLSALLLHTRAYAHLITTYSQSTASLYT